ncbi:1-phosphofructokinase [Verrucomicrobiota bacterium sgz303538]
MEASPRGFDVVTITLNPAIDQTITIRNFRAGSVNRVEQSRSNPGGKGVNVACALADYGREVATTGFLGRENDDAFRDLFERKQITDEFVRIDGKTRIGIKIADPEQHQTTDINFPGAAPSADDIAAMRARAHSLDAKWCVLAGSIPPSVDSTVYRNLTAELKARGRKVVIDTSGVPLQQAIQAIPHVIKPNVHELGELIGRKLSGETDIAQAARELVESGIELVAISMGEEGACFVTANEVVIARPPAIEVKSTVGAGDAMVAGIVAARLVCLSLSDTARLSTAFSLSVLSRGEPGLGSSVEVENLMRQVTCQ